MNLKPVMTTTEVANILKVTNNTVSTWFDKGLIDGYRNPGASTRRIPENAFSEFVKTHKIPIARLQKEKFFTTSQSAFFCFVSRNTLVAWISKGHLPAFTLATRMYVFKKDLLAFMEQNYIPLTRIKKRKKH